MPVLSIFCRFASWVTGGSSVSVSVSLSAVSSRTCVGRWSCCDRGSASRFRLPPRLWSTVRRVVVRKRVILGCNVTLCLCRLAPGVSSVLVRIECLSELCVALSSCVLNVLLVGQFFSSVCGPLAPFLPPPSPSRRCVRRSFGVRSCHLGYASRFGSSSNEAAGSRRGYGCGPVVVLGVACGALV